MKREFSPTLTLFLALGSLLLWTMPALSAGCITNPPSSSTTCSFGGEIANPDNFVLNENSENVDKFKFKMVPFYGSFDCGAPLELETPPGDDDRRNETVTITCDAPLWDVWTVELWTKDGGSAWEQVHTLMYWNFVP